MRISVRPSSHSRCYDLSDKLSAHLPSEVVVVPLVIYDLTLSNEHIHDFSLTVRLVQSPWRLFLDKMPGKFEDEHRVVPVS